MYNHTVRVIFTDHAKLRMSERDITIDDVCEALQNPEVKMPGKTGAVKIFSTVRRGKICIVYAVKSENVFRIISTWWR